MITEALLPAPTLYVDQTPLERVTKFRYLGRILSQDNHDLSTCVRNIQRAKAKWTAVSKVLKREGASQKLFARFYLVIVSTVLLYGSDTWGVTRRMEELLTSFHDRCLGQITRRFIRCTDTENDIWVTPSITGVLGGSPPTESSAGHVLRPRPPKRSAATCHHPLHLPTLPPFDSILASPNYFLGPTNTTSRLGSLDLFRDLDVQQ
jgi:hypothetical protein